MTADTTTAYVGRKMKVGGYRYNEKEGKWGYFMGYCPCCNNKLFLDRDEAVDFSLTVKHKKRPLSARLAQRLADKYAV